MTQQEIEKILLHIISVMDNASLTVKEMSKVIGKLMKEVVGLHNRVKELEKQNVKPSKEHTADDPFDFSNQPIPDIKSPFITVPEKDWDIPKDPFDLGSVQPMTGKVEKSYLMSIELPAIIDNDILNRVKRCVAEQGAFNVKNIKDDSTMLSLGLDSLDEVELVMALEDEFLNEIKELPDDEEIEPLGTFTVLEIAYYIQSKIPNIKLPNGIIADENAHEDKYLDGMKDGIKARSKGNPALFIAGDENESTDDSPAYQAYIEGYINGFNS